jgi:addiction module RelE/StbE family toxin
MEVVVSRRAQRDFDQLPASIRHRVVNVFERLTRWPQVSGTKQLTGPWKGFARIRTGDWRVIFRPEDHQIVVERIAHRREVYD